MDEIRDLNPAILEPAYEGKRLLPMGYRLRLPLPKDESPDSAARVFLAGFDQIPAMYKFTGPHAQSTSQLSVIAEQRSVLEGTPMFLVGIAGGSGSGKTTFAKKIIQRVSDPSVALLHQDSYYLPSPPVHLKLHGEATSTIRMRSTGRF